MNIGVCLIKAEQSFVYCFIGTRFPHVMCDMKENAIMLVYFYCETNTFDGFGIEKTLRKVFNFFGKRVFVIFYHLHQCLHQVSVTNVMFMEQIL